VGALQLSDFTTELWTALDTREEVQPASAGGSGTTDSRMARFLNASYTRVQLPTTFEHVELQSSNQITLATGTKAYDVSAYWALDHIRFDSRGQLLQPRSRPQLSNMIDQSGPPTAYARWGNTVTLDKAPTSAENGLTLTIYGWLLPQTTLAASGPGSQLRAEWDEVILQGAAWRGWLYLGDLRRADFHRESYAALLNDHRTVLSIEAMTPGWATELPMQPYARGSYGRV
jgi:hypothetical protein